MLRGCVWLWHVSQLFNRHLSGCVSGSAVYGVNTKIFPRLHVHVVECCCGTLSELFNRHQARSCKMSERRSSTYCTCTWLHMAVACVRALHQIPGCSASTRRSSFHVHVVKGICGCGVCQSSATDTSLARVGLDRPPRRHRDLPQTSLTPARGCVQLWHVSELFSRHQAGPCISSIRRSSTDCTKTCTWLCVAMACVGAFQQTPGSAFHRVNTENFHRLH